MTENTFNWAFIGAGRIARLVAKRITRCGRHRIVAVYNRTQSRAEKLAKQYGGKAYDTLEAAVNADGVDGVYVAVTNNMHYEYCARALACGKPVLLEKPFTTDAEEARRLFELAKTHGVYLCEAMWTWFGDRPRVINTLVNGGEIGNVKNALITLCWPIAFGKNNRLLRSELAGGALLDVGVYPITYAYRLFGKPSSVTATARFKCGVDVDDEVVLHYGKFDVTAKASVRGFRGVGERLVINGDGGSITSGNYHSGGGFTLKTASGVKRFKGDSNAMLTQFDRVVEEILAGKKQSEYVPPQSTIDVMELLDDIRKQIGLRYSFENA